MAQKTPKLHDKGKFEVGLPFALVSGAVYECIAIRSFVDLQKEGIDVLAKYYTPHAIAEAIYNADRLAGANIITLASPNQATIYIPDTYITALPLYNTVAYSQVVLSVSLGAVPDALDLTFLIAQLSAVCSDVIGIEPTVNKHIAPSTGVITSAEHDVLETARIAAIANRTTDRAKVIAQQAIIDEQASRLAGLEAYVIAHPPGP